MEKSYEWSSLGSMRMWKIEAQLAIAEVYAKAH